MSSVLTGKTIAFLVAPEGVERVELTEPWAAVEQAGGTPRLVSTAPGTVQSFDHLDKAATFPVDEVVGDVDAAAYDGLVLPGGVANPDQLRTEPAAVAFAKAFFDAGKPVAVICHGPWTLVEAGVLGGKTLTSWPSLQTDIRRRRRHLGRRGGLRLPGGAQHPGQQPRPGRSAGLERSARRGLRGDLTGRLGRAAATPTGGPATLGGTARRLREESA